MRTETLDVRVYYDDTDAGGVVYHGSYLNFAEHARTEYLRSGGSSNSDIAKDHNVIFVVRHMEIDYIKPAFLDDLLQVRTHVESIKNSSFIMRQTIHKGELIICDMRVTLVCVDVSSLKPVRMPPPVREQFE